MGKNGWCSVIATVLGVMLLPPAMLSFSAGLEDIIGPRPSAEGQTFDCQTPDLWKNVWLDRQQATTASKGGLVALVWRGNAFPALVQSSEKLPLKPGYGDEVRVVWKIGIDKPEFGAIVSPMLVQFTADGKELGSVGVRDQWRPTAPGRFRRVGITWKPDAQARYVAPALKFTGNGMTVRLKSIRLDPAEPKPLWNPLDRWKARAPAVRYDVDGLEPQVDKPQLTSEEVDRLLARCHKAWPKLKRRQGRVELLIDGTPVSPTVYMAPVSGLEASHYGEMADIGFPICTLYVATGPKSHTPAAQGNLWLGKGKYDFEPVKQGIRWVLARSPKTYVLLNLNINVHNDWGLEHPGDVHTNAKGEKGIAIGSRVVRYGGAPPGPNEFWEASNHSRQFREDASQMLKALGQWLESMPEGKVVIGAYLNGSADGQWLFSNEWEFADYSKGALDAFRDYLREKYHGDEKALRERWGTSVTFESATMPAFGLRQRQRGRGALMSYNGREAWASDYNDFLSMSNTRRQLAFCRALKEGTHGRLLCGSYWPTLPAAYPLCHGDFWEMLNSKDVDFISRGGLLGAAFHGELTIDEHDLRNLKSGVEPWCNYDDPYIAKSQAEFHRQALHSFVSSFVSGGGFHLYDMWGGWYWHPETRRILKECLALQQAVKDAPPLGDQYVGVFVDEAAADHLANLGRYYLEAAVESTFISEAWKRSGVPVRFFLTHDALNRDLVVPRVSVFLNPLTMDLRQAEAVKARFCRSNRVVVFMLAPGLAAPGDEANPERITGFKIHEDERTINKQLVIKDIGDPLLTGIRPGSILCYWNEHMQWYSNISAEPGSPGKVLACYAGTKIPGMLVDRRQGYTAVWLGAPGAISPALIRNLAREAGMKPVIESDNLLTIGAGFLAVTGLTGGPEKVTLPKGYIIERCLTGHAYQVKSGVLTFTLGWGDFYGDVAVFEVKRAT